MAHSLPKQHERIITSESQSTRSPSYEEELRNTIALREKLVTASSDPGDILRRFLSTKSALSTSSSFAERQQAAVGNTQFGFRHIGAGQCGVVFEIPGTTWAYKWAKRLDDHLWNDYTMLLRVLEACETAPHELGFRVPVPHFFIANTDEEWWHENEQRFPKDFRGRGARVLCMERVLPLAQPIRDALIDKYCPESIRRKARNTPGEQDCLVRVYLGRKREQLTRIAKPTWSLRNYKLNLDQMMDLDLDIRALAESMADALAIMHWKVGVDAGDVEFVLGSTPGNIIVDNGPLLNRVMWKDVATLPPNTSTRVRPGHNFKLRHTQLWLIDFNRCKSMTPDTDGIVQAVKAFYVNDPYYPRPCGETEEEERLWECFRARYLKTSARYVDEETKNLPMRLVDAMVAEQRVRIENKRLAEERIRVMGDEDNRS
jgi:hypothetical protein